jgi:hypothetical protein
MFSCSACGSSLIVSEIKYFTADKKHVFCDAYCSHEWYSKLRKHKEEDERTNDDRSD